MADAAFAAITFRHDGRPVPFADPAELLATVADPRFSHLLAERPDDPAPDHFAQVAATGDGFAFEVWRDGEPVVEQFLDTPDEVIEAFRSWATGGR